MFNQKIKDAALKIVNNTYLPTLLKNDHFFGTAGIYRFVNAEDYIDLKAWYDDGDFDGHATISQNEDIVTLTFKNEENKSVEEFKEYVDNLFAALKKGIIFNVGGGNYGKSHIFADFNDSLQSFKELLTKEIGDDPSIEEIKFVIFKVKYTVKSVEFEENEVKFTLKVFVDKEVDLLENLD